MSRRQYGLKIIRSSSNERRHRQSGTNILLAVVGVMILSLSFAIVVVATQNAKQNDNAILDIVPLAAELPEVGQIKTGDFGASVNAHTLSDTDSLGLNPVGYYDQGDISEITEPQVDDQLHRIAYSGNKDYVLNNALAPEEPAPKPEILYGAEVEDVITGKKMYSKLDFVSNVAPNVRIDLTLANDNNFVGKKLYSKDVALIQNGTGQKLAAAADALANKGYQLVLWDAYRPYSVSVAMYEIVNNPALVADPKKGSKHNRGAAVDVTLYQNGSPLNMPTSDRLMDLDKVARGSDMTTEQRLLLDILTEAMVDAGFVTYSGEWWHFNDSYWKDYPVMDYPLDMF